MIEETHDVLVEKIRTGIGKKPTPSVGIIDSQSVKACNICEGDVGYDSYIHAANIHGSVGAREVLRSLQDKYLTGIQKIFADGGCLGELTEWVRIQYEWTLEIVKRNETGRFKVLPKRWIVERTFAWFTFHRKH